MEHQIIISIIMPTLNEEKKIEKALNSIRKQTIPEEQIEILVIDGGSTDKTKEIALKYGAQILENPDVYPEAAKRIGISSSVGKYVIFMDADEELTDNNQLQKRINLFNNSKVKAVLANCLKTPKDYPSLARYINCYGDAFSYFVYKLDSENLIDSFDRKKFNCIKINEGRIYALKKNDVTPIGDGGTTMLDMEFMKKELYSKFNDPDFSTTCFNDVAISTGCFGIVEGDTINHYSSALLKTFLKKLRFRIIVNLNPANNISGYIARSKVNNNLSYRKYLYLLYCLLFPVVLYDSIKMCIKKKNIFFIFHVIFTYYILFLVIYYSFLKIIGKKVNRIKYGK